MYYKSNLSFLYVCKLFGIRVANIQKKELNSV